MNTTTTTTTAVAEASMKINSTFGDEGEWVLVRSSINSTTATTTTTTTTTTITSLTAIYPALFFVFYQLSIRAFSSFFLIIA